jgi:hypothetical protein
MSADEIRLPSPEAVASLAGRELSELDRLVTTRTSSGTSWRT